MYVDFVQAARPGHIVGQERWEGELEIGGDIVVHPGARLVLADGVRVGVRRGDERSAGFDPDRSELIVYGELVQEGAASFFSTASRPGALDWAGLFLMDGQGLDEETLDVQNARFGTVRARLPSGLTTWRGNASDCTAMCWCPQTQSSLSNRAHRSPLMNPTYFLTAFRRLLQNS